MSVPRNPNSRAMRAIAEELRRSGVTDACISPGSRSTAMALALARAPGLRPWVLTDERSAGFFALGMARETRRPVVLLCTSGTAAANYLPAVVEASLSWVPLVVLTADRPPELRDCHAAQTIDQVRLFGSHVRWSAEAPAPAAGVDLDAYYRRLACRAVTTAREAPQGPVHVNLPMREPLVDIDEEQTASTSDGPETDARDVQRPATVVHVARALPSRAAVRALAGAFGSCERGLIVCGPGAARAAGAAEAITRLARQCRWPVLADPLSGLRFGRHDRSRIVDAYDVVLRDPEFGCTHAPDAVLRLGAPPVSPVLQHFLAGARGGSHVVVAPAGSWPDPLHRATDMVRADTDAFCSAVADLLADAGPPSPWLDSWLAAAAAARAALDGLLAREPMMFEGTVLARLCEVLPDGTALHVGNSLPVRALDTFVGGSSKGLTVSCNRGANGIDGVLSAALGAAAVHREPTVLVLGDLSFLHDIGALQLAARHHLSLLVVVINNDGGGIFSFLPQAALGSAFDNLFATPHGLDLSGTVAICGGRHAIVRSPDDLATAVERWLQRPGLEVIEVPSDRERMRETHARLLAAALARRDAEPTHVPVR